MNNNTTNQAGNRPAKHIRYGAVRVTLWKDRRSGPAGNDFDSWTATMDRAYKDAKGTWQNTGSLRENDIPKAVAALQKAFAFIVEKGGEEESDVSEETVR